MVKQKVVTADFRRAVSKSGHDFGLALLLHVVLAIFCQNLNVFFFHKALSFPLRLGSHNFQNIRP